jgi:hypothetical protein
MPKVAVCFAVQGSLQVDTFTAVFVRVVQLNKLVPVRHTNVRIMFKLLNVVRGQEHDAAGKAAVLMTRQLMLELLTCHAWWPGGTGSYAPTRTSLSGA